LIETAKKHARTEQHSASETAPTDTPAATDGEAVANAEEIGQVEVEGLHAKTDLEKVEIRRARAERMLKIIGAR